MTNAPGGTLSDFLLARIAEDEAVAEAALAESAGEDWALDLDAKGRAGFGHIVRHDPARVLAECDAKRRIVELSTTVRRVRQATSRPGVHDVIEVREPLTEGCEELVLRALALPYTDHPDYRDEWRP